MSTSVHVRMYSSGIYVRHQGQQTIVSITGIKIMYLCIASVCACAEQLICMNIYSTAFALPSQSAYATVEIAIARKASNIKKAVGELFKIFINQLRHVQVCTL